MAAALRLLPGSDDLAPILSVSGEHDMLLAHVVRSLSAAPHVRPFSSSIDLFDSFLRGFKTLSFFIP
jgi:hypothetical protein